MSLLYKACTTRNIEEIKSILISCNKVDEEAYFLVCSNGDIEILELILQNSIKNNKLDIHINNEYALKIACKYNKLDVIDYLIKFGEEYNNKFCIFTNNNEIIKIACEYSCIDIVKYLLYYCDTYNILIKFEHEEYDILYNVSKNNSVELLKYLFDYFDIDNIISYNIYDSMFITACRCCNLEIIKYISNKFDINLCTNFEMYFSEACHTDKIDVVAFLLKQYSKGMKKETIYSIVYIIFKTSCVRGNINILKFIIDYSTIHNYNLNVIFNGVFDTSSTFIEICDSGNIELVKFITSIIPITYYESYIIDAYNSVCSKGHTEIIEYLLHLMAENKIKCNDYYDDLLKNNKRSKLIELVLDNICTRKSISYTYYKTKLGVSNLNDLDFIKFLLDECTSINKSITLFKKCIRNVLESNNVELVSIILNYNIKQTTNILLSTHTFVNVPILCNIRYIIILKYLIEYCFKHNIIIDLYTSKYVQKQILFYNAVCDYEKLKYLLYLSKHNYNIDKYKLFIYKPFEYQIFEFKFLDTILNCSELFFTYKCVKHNSINYVQQNNKLQCVHTYKFVINNNLMCIKCCVDTIYTNNNNGIDNNYTLYTI